LRQRAGRITALLAAQYPGGGASAALCSLDARGAFQLLAAARLSAQCTDARVNLVTPGLFARYPTAEAMAAADLETVETLVHSCGFHHTKARDLIAMAQQLCQRHAGEVPSSMEDLTALRGVGRKIANLIRGDVFGLPAVVADTHVIRITNLLGLVNSSQPEKVEAQLRALLNPAQSNDFCHRCVLHGRAVCIARRPQCSACVLQAECETGKLT
jgi:endonuclease-3